LRREPAGNGQRETERVKSSHFVLLLEMGDMSKKSRGNDNVEENKCPPR